MTTPNDDRGGSAAPDSKASPLALVPSSAVSPRLNRDRILAALADALSQDEIDRAAETAASLATPAEVIGMLAILSVLRDSRTEAAHDAVADGFSGDEERDEAARYDRIFGEMADEWQ